MSDNKLAPVSMMTERFKMFQVFKHFVKYLREEDMNLASSFGFEGSLVMIRLRSFKLQAANFPKAWSTMMTKHVLYDESLTT
jgi:hypothetical protein